MESRSGRRELGGESCIPAVSGAMGGLRRMEAAHLLVSRRVLDTDGVLFLELVTDVQVVISNGAEAEVLERCYDGW